MCSGLFRDLCGTHTNQESAKRVQSSEWKLVWYGGACLSKNGSSQFSMSNVHSCQVCGKSFSERSVFNKHFRHYHKQNESGCLVCGRKFYITFMLKNHTALSHTDVKWTFFFRDRFQDFFRHQIFSEMVPGLFLAPNSRWDRFRDSFRYQIFFETDSETFLVLNFSESDSGTFSGTKNFQTDSETIQKIQKSRERDETDTETQTDVWSMRKKDTKIWKDQVGKSWDREVSRPRPNISVTDFKTFFSTNFFSEPDSETFFGTKFFWDWFRDPGHPTLQNMLKVEHWILSPDIFFVIFSFQLSELSRAAQLCRLRKGRVERRRGQSRAENAKRDVGKREP